MTSEARRFPIGLTLAAAVVFAACVALGVWQLQRLAWKDHELARIAAEQAAPARPIVAVLAMAARGRDVELVRVAADCGPEGPQMFFRMSADAGQWAARAMAACRLEAPPYDGIVVDRGVFDAARGQTTLPMAALPAPGHVEGALRRPLPGLAPAGLAHPAPYVLVAERESPPAPGVTPSPMTRQAPESLHYVGAYAPTWFGLAAVVAGVYAAMLWRRRRPKA